MRGQERLTWPPELHLHSGSVFDLEHLDLTQQIESHGGDLSGMLVTVPDGKTRYHHVRISDRLYLW